MGLMDQIRYRSKLGQARTLLLKRAKMWEDYDRAVNWENNKKLVADLRMQANPAMLTQLNEYELDQVIALSQKNIAEFQSTENHPREKARKAQVAKERDIEKRKMNRGQ